MILFKVTGYAVLTRNPRSYGHEFSKTCYADSPEQAVELVTEHLRNNDCIGTGLIARPMAV